MIIDEKYGTCYYASSPLDINHQITKDFPTNRVKAPLVKAEASGYSDVHTNTCYGDFQVGFSQVALTHGHCVYQPSDDMLDSFCLIPKCLSVHLS